MKYKVGDEVLVKAKIISGSRKYFGVEVECERFDVCEDNIVPVPDMTADEAWEIAKKIEDMSCEKRREIFGTDHKDYIFQENTEKQAKAKIEAWEAEKEIKVGDEVALKSDPCNNDYKFFVTYIDKAGGRIGGWSRFGGDVFAERDIKRYQKTGIHINIEGLLKQNGEDK